MCNVKDRCVYCYPITNWENNQADFLGFTVFVDGDSAKMGVNMDKRKCSLHFNSHGAMFDGYDGYSFTLIEGGKKDFNCTAVEILEFV